MLYVSVNKFRLCKPKLMAIICNLLVHDFFFKFFSDKCNLEVLYVYNIYFLYYRRIAYLIFPMFPLAVFSSIARHRIIAIPFLPHDPGATGT